MSSLLKSNITLAEVIVDVPAQSTDHVFDYIIPESLRDTVRVGSRIVVPFGARKLMGYVVKVKNGSLRPKLKEILRAEDISPPLTEELVQLGLSMAKRYLCHTTIALQAMLPTVLRGKYKRALSLGPNYTAEYALEHLVGLTWEEAVALPPTTQLAVTDGFLRKLVLDQVLLVEYLVGDKRRTQKALMISSFDDQPLNEQLAKLNKRAHKQQQVLAFFADHPNQEFSLPTLKTHGFSSAVIKGLVEQKLLKVEEKYQQRDPYANYDFVQSQPLALTTLQQEVLDKIVGYINQKRYESILLHGVTGSGKTEVYLQAIAAVLQMDREVIALVPEISLTPQMVERFKSRFGDSVAVLHSRLSSSERYDEWSKIRNGQVKIAIGARSAVFAPFKNLGLLIIDEEHESSYRQDDSPKYDTREIAKWRSKWHKAVLLMGSATPSVDSYYDARTQRQQLLELPERVLGRALPTVEVVDMRLELAKGNRHIFSKLLQEQLQQCIANKEQAILLLNRRGFATFVMCRACGVVVNCTQCDISLTYHKHNQTVRCHYCGHEAKVPECCPECSSTYIRYFGIGTQRIEEDLLELFPELRVIRMDVDTTSKKGSHERLLADFASGKADVLLGTQMIAKGLDFPRVTLVGVITADTMLNLPDFRAEERTFQLLMQVGGRAGRHEAAGRVIVQTYNADHYSIKMMAEAETEAFYRQELLLRKKHCYPPFYGLFTLMFSHPDSKQLALTGNRAVQYCRTELPLGCTILGPVQAGIFKLKNRYRWQVLIKYPSGFAQLDELCAGLSQLVKDFADKNFRISIESEYR